MTSTCSHCFCVQSFYLDHYFTWTNRRAAERRYRVSCCQCGEVQFDTEVDVERTRRV